MRITVSDTVINAIIEHFQDEHRIQEGVKLWARHKADLSPKQDEALTAAHAAAQAKFSDPLRFFGPR